MQTIGPAPGWGLEALIPSERATPPPASTSDFSALVDALHEQNLRALHERFSLSTVVGLHRPRSGTDRAYVETPGFDELAPTEAMELFDRLRRSLEQRTRHHVIETEDGLLLGVVSSGPSSRAAYLFDHPSESDRSSALVDAASALGDLVHSLEATVRRPSKAAITAEIEPTGDGAHRAVVQIIRPGREPVESVVIGSHPASAAALAAARTLDPDARVTTLRCTEVSGEPVVLAVVSVGDAPPAMGVASSRGGPHAAVARAAYRAAAFAV